MDKIPTTGGWQNATDLLGRVLLTAFFLIFGVMKITGYAGFAAYMHAHGVPAALLPLVIVTELGGGLAVLLGWHTRIAAFLLAGFSLLAVLLFHLPITDQAGMITVLAELAVAGGFLALTAHGAAGWSLDARRGAAPSAATRGESAPVRA